MAIFSPLRSRRYRNAHIEATKQMIAFRLRHTEFALPIDTVVKVIPLGNIYGDPQQQGVAVTIYHNKELLVVDVAQRIFQDCPSSLEQLNNQRFLLILQIDQEFVGLPIDSPPAIRKIPASAIKPLPHGYITQGNIKCVSSMIIQIAEESPLFLLDPQLLS